MDASNIFIIKLVVGICAFILNFFWLKFMLDSYAAIGKNFMFSGGDEANDQVPKISSSLVIAKPGEDEDNKDAKTINEDGVIVVFDTMKRGSSDPHNEEAPVVPHFQSLEPSFLAL